MWYKNSNMTKYLTLKMKAFYAVFFLCCVIPLKGWGQNGESTVDALVEMGFENVGWTEDDSERVYVLQNSAYRLNGVGIGKAVDVIQEMGLPENKPCRIIVLDNNVPQISLRYRPIIGDSVPAAERRDWNVTYDLGDSWSKARKVKLKNRSLFKVDVLVYPELSLKNLIITQIYQVLFNLSPAIEVSFWKGMKLTAQVVIPVYNDGYGEAAGKVHPGFLTLQQKIRLPYNFWATGTVGVFNGNRYGGDLRVEHVLKADERFSFEGRVGLTATHSWNGFEFTYGTKTRWTWDVGATFYWPKYNLQSTLKIAQYMLGEKGIRFDCIRHFRYVSIGFYAMKAQGVRANGGFRFQIALPPYRYKRKGYIPRVSPSYNMGMAYNAGNERFYYKGYRTNPSENIMYDNSFNPYFIKSELLNY